MSNTPNETVRELYRIIRENVEDSGGDWNGGDVVDALNEWFASHGIDVAEPNPFRTDDTDDTNDNEDWDDVALFGQY